MIVFLILSVVALVAAAVTRAFAVASCDTPPINCDRPQHGDQARGGADD
jgi:hypothetical protein